MKVVVLALVFVFGTLPCQGKFLRKEHSAKMDASIQAPVLLETQVSLKGYLSGCAPL